VNKDSTSSNAALSLVEEESDLSLAYSEVHVCVVHDDVGGFAAKLKSNSLKVMLVSISHNVVTNFGGSSKGDLVNISVLSQVSSA
jgi:hypothetical protein